MAMAKGQLEMKLKEEHELINRGVLREENPLDQSEEFRTFLEACRRGDLKQCQDSITAGININGKDEFDYTPLIVASLCGHYEVVRLLLEAGALAERNTFQGERCLYNALNDRIRNLLLEYDYSKSSDPLQPWAAHITSLLTRTTPATADITLTASAGPGLAGDAFALHKFLLAARTPYFRRKLATAPEMDAWRLSSQVPAAAFRFVLHYLYLDDLTPHAAALALPGGSSSSGGDDGANDSSVGNSFDDGDDNDEAVFRAIDRISKQLEIEHLWEALLAGNDRRLARQRYEDEVARAQRQVAAFFQQHILGNKMVVGTSKVDDVKWRPGNFIFADCLLCADEVREEEDDDDDDDDDDNDDDNDDDEAYKAAQASREGENARARRDGRKEDQSEHSIPIGPADAEPGEPTGGRGDSKTGPSSAARRQPPPSRRRSVLYPAHKAMLVRSGYFATMFSSAFLEAQASDHLRTIRVDCSPAVLEIVLAFLYTETATIPLPLALDVLYAADMLLLDKLKTRAAVALSTLGSGSRDVLRDPTREDAADKGDGKGSNGGGGDDDDYEIDIYDVMHAAWDLRVQRLEEFGARFLAQRLEHHIGLSAFADLVRESASRIRTRHETDSIELVDDIRYYLSERFRLRFEDVALSDIEGERGETEGGAEDGEREKAEDAEAGTGTEPGPGVEAGAGDGTMAATNVLRTLDGTLVEDEFDSDALNYEILLGKIDSLLERLGLDG